METLHNFESMVTSLTKSGTRKRVAVVCATDEHTLWAVEHARELGFIDPIFIDNDDKGLAAQEAVAMVRRKEADLLMKGLINSDTLLHAILHRETGILPQGRVLTHMGVAEMSAYPKLIVYSDAAVIPFPTHEQRIAQTAYVAAICHKLGITSPKIALIHCSEKPNEKHFPYTMGYADIIRMAREGVFGACVVDGPLDLKTSCDKQSLDIKGINSPINGEADGLIFPNIEAGNLFHKSITLFCDAEVACLLQGTEVPVVMTSRSDSRVSKFFSLALGVLMAE